MQHNAVCEETEVIFEANILSLEEVCVAVVVRSAHIPFLMGRSGPVNIDEWPLQSTPLECDSCKDFSDTLRKVKC